MLKMCYGIDPPDRDVHPGNVNISHHLLFGPSVHWTSPLVKSFRKNHWRFFMIPLKMDWFKGKFTPENPMILMGTPYLMGKYRWFPVKIFPRKPIHGFSLKMVRIHMDSYGISTGMRYWCIESFWSFLKQFAIENLAHRNRWFLPNQ